MPIKVKKSLPAVKWLKQEGIFVMNDDRAENQDIRPLHLLILNLMPNKETTELQLLRLISQTPLQINVDFLRIKNHAHKNSDHLHLDNFYKTFDEVKELNYDALIVTGAPIEKLDFEKVDYWPELVSILDWAKEHVTSSLFICWGAQAALNHYYGISKTRYTEKLFGVYPQKALDPTSWLLRGFDDVFYTPQSRFTGIDFPDGTTGVKVLANSDEIGETILISEKEDQVFVLGHFEYDTTSLKDEYNRDIQKGEEIDKPKNYSIENGPTNNWRSSAYLFFHNWINQVYQETPYQLTDIPNEKK